MSLHYLLDGYNIIKNMPELARLNLDNGRVGLIRLIDTCRPQGSARNKVTVVFDGKSGIVSPPHGGSSKVIFTSDEPADEEIKRIVQSGVSQKQMVVVTDDRGIQYSVRALGASVLSVKDFCGRMKTGSVGDPGQSSPTVKRVSKTLEHEITEELEGLWLKDKKQRGSSGKDET